MITRFGNKAEIWARDDDDVSHTELWVTASYLCVDKNSTDGVIRQGTAGFMRIICGPSNDKEDLLEAAMYLSNDLAMILF